MIGFLLLTGIFIGCGEKKYDVSIKIRCQTIESDTKIQEAGEWIFTPDKSEIHISREYDGLEHQYYIDSYNLSKHPRWSKEWFTPTGQMPNVFRTSLQFRNEGGYLKSFTGPIKECGEYIYRFEAINGSDLWNFRAVYLYVNIY